MEGIDEALREADRSFAWIDERWVCEVFKRTMVDSYLEKTCSVLEGAGFEEPEPILLEEMENNARYTQRTARNFATRRVSAGKTGEW